MKKRVVVWFIVFLLALPFAFAGYEMTYNFNQNNVTVYAFDCLDQVCSQVSQFSGSISNQKIINGVKTASTTNGKIIVNYPRTLQNFGYVLFFTSPGFVPKEERSTLNTGRGPSVRDSTNIIFNKIPLCRAPVQSLSFVNQVQPNTPVIINTSASLDADTLSAFSLTNNSVEFIPEEILYEYYGADTQVDLNISLNGSVVFSESEVFDKNHSIVAGTSKPVSFLFVPDREGNYTVKVTAKVIDSQCSAHEDLSAESLLKVFNSSSDACYTILNGLFTVPANPEVDDFVSVSFNKTSNYVYPNGSLLPVETEVSYLVKNSNVVYSRKNWVLVENSDPAVPETFGFDFIPDTVGVYDIIINAKALSALCSQNPEVNISKQIYVSSKSFEKIFQAVFFVKGESSDGLKPVEGAVIAVKKESGVEQKSTDENGKAIFYLNKGVYDFNVSAEKFKTFSGKMNLQSNQTFQINLNTYNYPPTLNFPSIISIPAKTSRTFDLADFVSDDNDLVKDLKWSVSGNGSVINVTISGEILNIFVGDNSGVSRVLKFTAFDSEKKSSSQKVTIAITAANAAPQISTLPLVNMTEDIEEIRAIDLYDYVSDSDNSFDELVFSVANQTSDDVSIVLENNRYISIIPKHNFFGKVNSTINVSDGLANSYANLSIMVNNVNDAPVILSFPDIPALNNQNFTLDLDSVFFDPDNDSLTCNVSSAENVSFNLTNPCDSLQILPDWVKANRTFNVTAFDGELATVLTLSIRINEEDQPPRIKGIIPNRSFDEDNFDVYDLTPYEDDLEDGPADDNNSLSWSAVNYNSSLINVSIDKFDRMWIYPFEKDVNGKTNVTLVLNDSKNQNDTQIILVTIKPVNDAPVIFIENKTAQINELFNYTINASDVDGDNLTFFDFSPLFSINSSTGRILFTPNIFGIHEINVSVCDNSSALNNCTNATFYLNVTDSKAPKFTGVLEPADPGAYDAGAIYNFTVNITDNGVIDSVIFEFNNINFTNATNITVGNVSVWTFNISNLSVGTYFYKWYANDTAGNENQTITYNFTIIKANNSINLTLNNLSSNISIGQRDSVNISAGLSAFSNGLLRILLGNNTLVNGTSPLTVNISLSDVGNYTITAVYDGDANFNPANVSYIITVNDTEPPVFALASVAPVNNSELEPSYLFSVNVSDNIGVHSVQLILNGPVSGVFDANLTNGSYFVNLTNLINGSYSYQWFSNDTSGNFNTTALVNYVILPDITNPQLTNASAPSSPAQFAPSYTFSISAVDNFGIDSVILDFNGTNYTASNISAGRYEVVIGPFSVGNYSYHWFANDTSNNINETAPQQFEIIKGLSSIVLSINGVQSDTSAPVNTNVSFFVNVTNPPNANALLYINSSLINNDSTPFTNFSVFNATGRYNVTVIFPGNANVSASQVTYFLTITPPIAKINIAPINDSHLNSSSFMLNVTTNNVTICAWDFVDVNQQNMSFNFITANGLNHSSFVSGLTLGLHNLYIACNNETSADNTDLVYHVDNIISNSDFIGNNDVLWNKIQDSTLQDSFLRNNTINQSSINQSIINQSIISQSVIDLSTVKNNSRVFNSSLTKCIIINSNVSNLPNASGENYINQNVDPFKLAANNTMSGGSIVGDGSEIVINNIILDSHIKFSNLINNNISSSYINNSNFSFSVINDSNISFSNISDSVVVNSIIENSWIINASVENAVIKNNNLTSGNITLPNGTKVQAPVFLPDVLNYPPKARFTPLTITITAGSSVNFDASSSSDLNVGSALNDSLTYLWTFHDNSNSTSITTSKTYSSQGSYNVTLTVTDNQGQSDSTSGTVIVNKAKSNTNNLPSGSSGGGSRYAYTKLNISSLPQLYTVNTREAIGFVKNNRNLPLNLYIYQTNTKEDSAEFIVGGKHSTLKVGDTQSFELTRDSQFDADITLVSVDAYTATIKVVEYGFKQINASPMFLPVFNFTGKSKNNLKENLTQKNFTNSSSENSTLLKKQETTIPVKAKIRLSFREIAGKLSSFARSVFYISSPMVKLLTFVLVIVLGLGLYFAFRRISE